MTERKQGTVARRKRYNRTKPNTKAQSDSLATVDPKGSTSITGFGITHTYDLCGASDALHPRRAPILHSARSANSVVRKLRRAQDGRLINRPVATPPAGTRLRTNDPAPGGT